MEPGTKLAMTRTRIDDGDEATVDPNQIWARARMMAVDPGLGAALEWERRVEAVGADDERRRRGGSRAMDEDDGGREEDEAIYI